MENSRQNLSSENGTLETTYGKPITTEEANNEIKEFINTQKDLREISKMDVLANHAGAAGFIKDMEESNVFVFDKDLIERFNGCGASHYVVCLGVGKNGATVLFAGCELIDDDGQTVTLKAVTPKVEPDEKISEHPPKRFVFEIGKSFLQNDELILQIKK